MNNKKNKKPWWEPGLVLFFRISTLIVILIILAVYIGKYFDNKYNTTPWIFVSLIFVAFLISIISIWKNLSKYLKNIEKENKKD